jgi:hypothetical protein
VSEPALPGESREFATASIFISSPPAPDAALVLTAEPIRIAAKNSKIRESLFMY